MDRVREQVLSNLRSNEKDPGTLASDSSMRWPLATTPMRTTGDGTIETVTALTRDDIVAAHKGALARDRIYVAAAGDITAEELGKLLDRLLGDLPATGAPHARHRALAAGRRHDGRSTSPRRNRRCSSAKPASRATTRISSPAFILNEVIGGGRFTARLMTEVREKRGLTYGIGTYLVNMDHADMLSGSVLGLERQGGRGDRGRERRMGPDRRPRA